MKERRSRLCSGYIKNGLTQWSKDDPVQEIEIPGNYIVKVDKWYYDKNCLYDWKISSNGYAFRRTKEGKSIYIHRDVLGVNDDESIVVDHIDGDIYNDCECNLRQCTSTENCYNKKKFEGKSSEFKGVSKVGNKWEASITKDGKRVSLGRHDDEVTAALHYDSAAVYLFGEFARINFPMHKEKLLAQL
jgi:hypothetical protein